MKEKKSFWKGYEENLIVTVSLIISLGGVMAILIFLPMFVEFLMLQSLFILVLAFLVMIFIISLVIHIMLGGGR